jgi:hypothetical protein
MSGGLVSSRGGLGTGLANVFEGQLKRLRPKLLRGPREQQLLVLCDIGDSQREQPYETFS